MLKIEMPAATLGLRTDERAEIAHGPFVAVHGNTPLLAGYMNYTGDGDTVVFATVERGYYIDDTYAIYSHDNSTLVYSDTYDSLWLFRPLKIEDADWMLEDPSSVTSLDELMEIAREVLAAS